MRKVLMLICLLSLSAALVLSYRAASYKEQVYAEAKEKYHAVTEKMAQRSDALLRRTMEAADSFAEGLTEGTISKSNMGGKFKRILKEYKGVYGGSITFSPFAYDPARKLYSVYFHRAENEQGKEELHFSQLDEFYDYTTPEYEWYVRPMSEQKNGWSNPYWDEAGKTYMITYSSLFYRNNADNGEKELVGVVTLDISMKYIKQLVDEQELGRSGFCAATTAEGRYIYHPVRDYVVEGKTLLDVAKEKNDKDREQLADMARKGQGGIIEHISTTTGEESWLMVEPLPITGWSLQNTFIKKDIEINTDVIRHRKVLACISAAVFMISLLALMLTLGSFSMKKVGIFVISSSIILITGIGCIWEYALKYKEHKDGGQDYIKITDQDMLDSFVSERTRIYIEKSFKKPSFIPTGVYIESMIFRSTTELSLSGNIWQEYPNDFPDDLKGVRIFPAIKSKIQQLYTKKLDNNSELIRSRFEVDIPVHISSSKYPLEIDEITVQFLSMDNSLATFVLDLKGTPVDATVRLPGLNKNVVLPGWTLTHTFFALEQGDADSSFGVKENYDQEELPVLSYRIGIKRIFINAFISNLTPLIVVTIILFFVLLLPSDTDISKIIGICSSLFFVVVFSHLAIRKTIVIGELFYLEYFFFVIYAAVVITPIRIFLLSLCREKDFLDYRNGLLFKAAYWPVLLGLLLVVTACEFY